MRFRPSANLLHQKRYFENLIKTHQYSEAHQIRDECNKLETEELKKFNEQKMKKLVKQEQQFLKKLSIDRAALEKKLVNQKNEQKTQREMETKK